MPLTDREREIAVLAAAGQSSRAIADRLYLSVRTIDNHLGRIYDKLGVSNRAELAAALDRNAESSDDPAQLELVRTSYATLPRRRGGDGRRLLPQPVRARSVGTRASSPPSPT